MKGLTTQQLQDAVGMSAEAARLWLQPINEAGQDCGLNNPARWAMWLAQCGHESMGFTRLSESMDYSPQRLLVVFGKYYTPELAARHGRSSERPADQKAIANQVYNGRMGNIPGSDDGWNFRAGGAVGLTGRDNYRACGDHLGVDLLEQPDLVRIDRRYAVKSSSWFWDTRRVNSFSDVGDLRGATKVINGGFNGLDDRQRRYDKALAALGGSAASALAEILKRA
jgi:putative chitinase